MKIRNKVAIGLMVAGLSAWGGVALADSADARACIVALNDGRQCCQNQAHITDQTCMIAASAKPVGAQRNAAIAACSDAYSKTASLCSSHYVDDVATCRSTFP